MTLQERLEEIRGERSIRAFAQMLGIHKNTYINYIKAKHTPDLNFIQQLCTTFHISANWLLFGVGPKFWDKTSAPDVDPSSDFVILPLLGKWISIGSNGMLVHGEPIDYVHFKAAWIHRLVEHDPERIQYLYLIRVMTNSMAPTISKGEMVLVDTSQNARSEIQTSAVYVLELPDGKVSLRRLAWAEHGDQLKLICFSDNLSLRGPFELILDSRTDVRRVVLGRIRWVSKEL